MIGVDALALTLGHFPTGCDRGMLAAWRLPWLAAFIGLGACSPGETALPADAEPPPDANGSERDVSSTERDATPTHDTSEADVPLPEADAEAGEPPPRRMYPPSSWILGPIFGSSCPVYGDCTAPSGGTGADPSPAHLAEVTYQLAKLRELDIPISAYHFDGPAWSTVGSCSWNLGDDLIAQLRQSGLRALLHVWGGCRYGEFGDAGDQLCGCFQESDWERVHAQLGDRLGGFYSDDGFSNDAWIASVMSWTHRKLPAWGEVVMKAHTIGLIQTDDALRRFGHTCFVNDLTSDFAGLRTGIRRVLANSSLLPAPFNELTGYDGRFSPDAETFFRRIHFGAMQMVMDHSPWMAANPWDSTAEVLAAYRYFAWLHAELIPYLYSYDYAAYETDAPVFREPRVTAEGVIPFEATTMLGNEIFVAYVAEPEIRNMDIDLPAGEWIDYWDPTRVFTGPARVSQPVPPGHEPIFVRSGSIIPLDVARDVTGHGTSESAGSLTLWVHAAKDSTFRYRDERAGRWFVFESSRLDGKLTLGARPWPTRPVLFRIERWSTIPSCVGVADGQVTIDKCQSEWPMMSSEKAVNGSPSNAWFFDAAAQRLIVKVVGI